LLASGFKKWKNQMTNNIKPAEKGLLIIYTGSGKGKTTAALGMALRASGWKQKVAIIQFIKGFKETGEWKAIEENPQIEIFQTFDDQKIAIGKPRREHQKAAENAIKLARKIISEKKYNLVILDEINNAIHYGLVEVGEIIKLGKEKPVEVSLVFTGRQSPKELIQIADLVTEMKEIKHPFKKGISAKKGIDF